MLTVFLVYDQSRNSVSHMLKSSFITSHEMEKTVGLTRMSESITFLDYHSVQSQVLY